MKSKTTFIVATLGVAALLAGCSAKSPTAPKPTPPPTSGLSIALTPESTTAQGLQLVHVVARVTTSGGGNAPDGTSVTFKVTGGVIVDCNATTVPVDDKGNLVGPTEAARTTSSGGTAVCVTSLLGTANISAGVFGSTATTAITFSAAVPPTPTPTPTGPPDYTPQIFVLTPNAGPFEGGTKVVITGTGFQSPVQVLFGTRQAQVTSSNYTEVDCIAPSITPEGPNAFQVVSVTVTNTLNGKVSNGVDYRYGETMYISGIEPPVGPQDTPTTVTIFGQGFVSPVSVTTSLATVPTWDVTSVSGTEIVARTRALPDTAYTCDNIPATIKVTNLGSNTSATSPAGAFTYQAVRPLITSVQIDGGGNTVPQYVPGTCNTSWSSHTVTIHGSGFQQGMTATFQNALPAGPTVGPVVTTFVDSNTLTLTLPDLTAVPINTVPCNDGGGQGSRNVATSVSVAVFNQRNTCSNTLIGAIVINPCVTSCQVLAPPTVASVSPNNGSIAGGDSVIITGTNFVNSGLSATFAGASASGVSFIDATHISATTPGHTPAGPVSVTVFCGGQSGTNASAFTYTATMDMTIAGTGTVSSSPAPFVGASPCSSGTCNWTMNASVVQLTASTTGTFTGWSGASCGCTGTTTPCSVTMNQARACTATFTP